MRSKKNTASPIVRCRGRVPMGEAVFSLENTHVVIIIQNFELSSLKRRGYELRRVAPVPIAELFPGQQVLLWEEHFGRERFVAYEVARVP